MTDRKRIVRRKKADLASPTPPTQADPAPADTAPEPPAQPPPKAASRPGRTPATSRARVDVDGLMAIADMDAAELHKHLGMATVRSAFAQGDRVQGTVQRLTKTHLFVDIGAKAEATLDREECPQAQVGDALQAFVLASDEHGVHLTTGLHGKGTPSGIASALAKRIAAQFWEHAAPGDTYEGTVASVHDWGVFVELQGVQGLIHQRELGWDDTLDPTTLFEPGTAVSVRILSLDRQTQKVALTLKDPAANPWLQVGTDYLVGQVYSGTVSGQAEFGVFVDLAPGLRGLVHASLSSAQTPPSPGQSVLVRILEIDLDNHRIALDWGDSSPTPSKPQGHTGSLGTLGDLFKGLTLD